MIIWQCPLCTKPPYIQRGRLVSHLVSVHRKTRYPHDEILTSAEELANKGKIEFNITKETL